MKLALAAAVFIAMSSGAVAQGKSDAKSLDSRLEQTMALLPQGAELPSAVTEAIDLPKDDEGEYRPNAAAIEHSAHGLEIANLAREDGRAFGQATAAAAQENREDHARGSRPDVADLRPDDVPAQPTLPDLPDLPELPDHVSLPDRPDHPTPPL
jgi:hypothetical protein